MHFLKQSTAVSIPLGPFVDSTDGFTPETGLTITAAEVRLKKDGNNWAAANEANDAVHEEEGWYEKAFDTTDTGSLGRLMVAVYVAGALPVFREFMVVPANVYDSLVGGTDTLQVDVAQWLGTAAATPTTAGVPEVDVTFVGGAAQDIATATALTTVDTVVDAIKAKTDNLPADPADASDIAASFTTVNTKLDTIDDFLDTEVAAIKAKTDNLPADPADASDIAASFTTVNTKLDTIDDFLDTEVAAIKSDTAAILLDTGTDGVVVGSHTAGAKTEINAEVLDVLNVDTFAEPGQEAPASTTTLVKKLGYLYKAWKNRQAQTEDTYSLYNDAGDTVDQTASVSDDGTTFTRTEIATGP